MIKLEALKLIVGLGNPGQEYKNTWHNVGFHFIDTLKSELKGNPVVINKKEYELIQYQNLNLLLLRPLKFMNRSGEVVAEILKFKNILPSETLIAHDDLDIVSGEFKIQFDKFPKVHNGLRSIHERVGTTEFNYLRIGIETRTPIMKANFPGEEYVLSRIPKEEQRSLNEALHEAAQEILKTGI